MPGPPPPDRLAAARAALRAAEQGSEQPSAPPPPRRLFGPEGRAGAGEPRARPPLDAARLHQLAVRYLERFDAPAAQLRRVLGRHLAKERPHRAPAELEALAAALEAVVARLVEAGAVNDRRFAEGVARGQRARGGSTRAIQARLAQRGVAAEVGAAALAEADRDDGDPELAAARALARRRRLGRHRPDAAERAARADRDLAVLARAGFSYSVARRALADDDPQG